MDNLIEVYSLYNNYELIKVLECKVDYEEKVIGVCEKILKERELSKAEIKSIAESILKDKVFDHFKKGGHWQDFNKEFKSLFLKKSEIKLCISEVFVKYKSRLNDAMDGFSGQY